MRSHCKIKGSRSSVAIVDYYASSVWQFYPCKNDMQINGVTKNYFKNSLITRMFLF